MILQSIRLYFRVAGFSRRTIIVYLNPILFLCVFCFSRVFFLRLLVSIVGPEELSSRTLFPRVPPHNRWKQSCYSYYCFVVIVHPRVSKAFINARICLWGPGGICTARSETKQASGAIERETRNAAPRSVPCSGRRSRIAQLRPAEQICPLSRYSRPGVSIIIEQTCRR